MACLNYELTMSLQDLLWLWISRPVHSAAQISHVPVLRSRSTAVRASSHTETQDRTSPSQNAQCRCQKTLRRENVVGSKTGPHGRSLWLREHLQDQANTPSKNDSLTRNISQWLPFLFFSCVLCLKGNMIQECIQLNSKSIFLLLP